LPQQPSYDENDLLFRVADGNEGAMRCLFELFYPRLYYFGFKLIREEAEAQDQAQEALTALWQRRDSFRQATLKEAEAFLFTVVRNRSYNYHKHRRMKAAKQVEITAGQDLSEDLIEARLVQEDVFNRIFLEIAQLLPGQVSLFRMIYLEGLDTNEIAEKLGITPNNVRNQKARALEKVRTSLLKKGLLHLLVLFFP
jgi:RNA polymerase sigma factor (sigma-70 family)